MCRAPSGLEQESSPWPSIYLSLFEHRASIHAPAVLSPHPQNHIPSLGDGRFAVDIFHFRLAFGRFPLSPYALLSLVVVMTAWVRGELAEAYAQHRRPLIQKHQPQRDTARWYPHTISTAKLSMFPTSSLPRQACNPKPFLEHYRTLGRMESRKGMLCAVI